MFYNRTTKAVVWVAFCLAAIYAGGGLRAQVKRKQLQSKCQSGIGCNGTSGAGYLTGTNPPQGCNCNFNSNNNYNACQFTGNMNDTCTYGSPVGNGCTGTVQGNPVINCYQDWPNCP